MRISDWSSDVCSSDLLETFLARCFLDHATGRQKAMLRDLFQRHRSAAARNDAGDMRSSAEEMYRLLAEGAGNRPLQDTLTGLRHRAALASASRTPRTGAPSGIERAVSGILQRGA